MSVTNEKKAGTRMHSQRERPAKITTAITIAAVSLGAISALWSFGSGTSGAAKPSARAAKSLSLNESGDLHLTSKQGFTLNERGTASGTIKGPIYVHLTIASTSRVTAEIGIYPNGGSITGYGTADYHKESTAANFAGTLSIKRGTGTYARAQGQGLSFSGTIQKSNDAVTVHVSGRASD
jgi:hypothetical protein